MEQRILVFVKNHSIVSAAIGFFFNSLPGWLSLILQIVAGNNTMLGSWLVWGMWISSLFGLALLVVIIWILRKPTIIEIPIILQKMHDRVNVLVKQHDKLRLSKDNLATMANELNNMQISDMSELLDWQTKGTDALQFLKDNVQKIMEQSFIALWQLGIAMDRQTKFIQNIKTKDKTYITLKKQLNNLQLPVPDRTVLTSIDAFLKVSEGYNSLLLFKPQLLELLSKQESPLTNSLPYIDKLDESAESQINEYRRQVAEAIDNYIYRRNHPL